MYIVTECLEREREIGGGQVDLLAEERKITLSRTGLPFTLHCSSSFSSLAVRQWLLLFAPIEAKEVRNSLLLAVSRNWRRSYIYEGVDEGIPPEERKVAGSATCSGG